MPLFRVERVEGQAAWLPKDELHHAQRVLRLPAGAAIGLIDGKGMHYEATLSGGQAAHAELTATHPNWGEPPVDTHLYLAPPKARERLEMLIEKAVELGVTHVHFLTTQHSERSSVKLDRLERIAWAALKQCQRSRLPKLLPTTKFMEALKALPQASHCLLHGQAEHDLLPALTAAHAMHVTLWVGPEGDWHTDELQAAANAGITPCKAGSTRLRTETAALHALSLRKGTAGY